jgi:hypothetical protein
VHREPRRPIATQVEEVLEVDESHVFEFFHEGRQLRVRVNGADGDEVTLDAELVGGEPQALIDCLTSETRALEGGLAEEDGRRGGRNRERHTQARVNVGTAHRDAAIDPVMAIAGDVLPEHWRND